jgi:hypothetical protein
MDSWISFILGFIESKNIQQALGKANDKARKFALKKRGLYDFAANKSKKKKITFFFKIAIAT